MVTQFYKIYYNHFWTKQYYLRQFSKTNGQPLDFGIPDGVIEGVVWEGALKQNAEFIVKPLQEHAAFKTANLLKCSK